MKVDAADQARTSIADFYQTYRNLIFKKANEMANDPDYVDDLAQDTLYQLLRREELFLSLSEAQQVDYCMKTIRNTAINHHKRNQKIQFLSENTIGEHCDPPPPWRKPSSIDQIQSCSARNWTSWTKRPECYSPGSISTQNRMNPSPRT